MIPLCDLNSQHALLKTEIDSAIQTVLASGQYILGPNVEAFEQQMAAYLGCEHAVGVNSGTDALQLALKALNIGPGDEVITTPFTFIATSEAIGMVGATPVFVDIDPKTYNIDPRLIPSAITPRTKAILPVHLYGQPCDMDAIMAIAAEHSLYVVEDCAQALGATYRGQKIGTFGDIGCLSFFPSKNLGCLGDGGMVVTNDRQVGERVEMLRRHGAKVKYRHRELGLNSRLDEIQAAVLRVKLPHLDRWNEDRRRTAHTYNRMFAQVNSVAVPRELSATGYVAPIFGAEEANSLLTAVYHQYTLAVEDRSVLQTKLRAAGIGSAVYYPVPLHLQEIHVNLGYRPGALPHAEMASQHCISLPMYPGLTTPKQITVVEAVVQAMGEPAVQQLFA